MPTSETGPAEPDRLPPPSGVIGSAGADTATASRPAARVPIDRKRQRSGDDARERAMRAAISVIAEKGTAALRMSDIAARAGMSTGHILYHFGKKDRLLLEVLAWSQADLWTRFQQAADRAASPAEKLDLFVRAYLPRHQGDERYALWTQVLAQRHDEAGKRILTELLDGWDERLEAILREGRDLGHFAEVDLPEFTVRAVAMLSGLAEDVMFGRPRWQHTSAHAFALSALERELRPTGQG
ncbi:MULTISPECIES: TetR/AcrR family transcriptional regulator [unclassified Streptomyces]|uniref:TetR/AcrR family transcriptional regulator n=1 Tax=unclassified Streptomyces TaxID=2593676 RepID=UPI001E3D3C69|nr:TetR/AcrR family transcriptional regulator [Streptomyces sp. MBT42]MCD2462078.1 TetR/AcrR family transcriptional regulator [Streptomyces sp. MBT42]